jgi:hypothetical protein
MQLILASVTAAFAATVFVPSHAEPLSERAIYRCESAGAVTFSDVPCDSTASEYQADASRVTTYTAPPASKVAASEVKQKKQSAKRKAASGSSVDDRAKQAAECARISGSLRDIRSKMRSGYGVKEGERLKQRQAKLEERRRAKHCR